MSVASPDGEAAEYIAVSRLVKLRQVSDSYDGIVGMRREGEELVNVIHGVRRRYTCPRTCACAIPRHFDLHPAYLLCTCALHAT